MITDSFLGKGWSFPPSFDKATKSVRMLRDEDDIQSSLEILLATMPGERIMQPRFGCNLDELQFESVDTTLKTVIKDRIETAILYYEPRIDLNDIELIPDQELEGVLVIVLTYTVRSTNSRFNFVYPFYKAEGSNLSRS